MSRNRGLDPSRMQCKECAADVFPTDLSRAEHRALHLEWLYLEDIGKGRKGTDLLSLRNAWRAYAGALEAQASELRRDIADRDDVIESLTADYEHVLAEVKAANVEVSRLRDQACMAAHR